MLERTKIYAQKRDLVLGSFHTCKSEPRSVFVIMYTFELDSFGFILQLWDRANELYT